MLVTASSGHLAPVQVRRNYFLACGQGGFLGCSGSKVQERKYLKEPRLCGGFALSRGLLGSSCCFVICAMS